MRISRARIESFRFEAKKGKYYNGPQVDAALEEISAGVDEMELELSRLEQRVHELQKREESVTEALLVVQRMSDQLIEQSKSEAQRIVAENAAKVVGLRREITALEKLRASYKDELVTQITDITKRTLAIVNSTFPSPEQKHGESVQGAAADAPQEAQVIRGAFG